MAIANSGTMSRREAPELKTDCELVWANFHVVGFRTYPGPFTGPRHYWPRLSGATLFDVF